MSHIVSITTQVKDPVAVRAACRHLGLPEPTHGTARLYSGQATGLLLHLPGWQYPAVLDTATGAIHYDIFQGRWGSQDQLDKFLQRYAVEKARREALSRGLHFTEQTLQDGSIKLTILGSP